MSTTIGRVVTGLTQVSLSGRIIVDRAPPNVITPASVRSLALSTQRSARSKRSTEVNNEPIKFSTSKASHRTWKVNQSTGSKSQPLWKVFSISLFATTFLLWCALRKETNIDAHLKKHLYERLPGLLSNEEEKTETKSR